MAPDIAIDIPPNSNSPKLAPRRSIRKPEWRTQLVLCTLVLLQKISIRLGQIATVWATTILLGGFVSGLPSFDFWVISALTLATAIRLFAALEEQKINTTSEPRRRVFWQWLLSSWFLFAPPKFHVSGSTIVAGLLDSAMFTLQVASALISLIFAALRLANYREFARNDAKNQGEAMELYYAMLVIEATLFIPSKLGWEVPRSLFFDKRVIFGITHDKRRIADLFEILERFFVQVIAVARENVALGLDMSLRRYISQSLLESPSFIDQSAAILMLDVLYQQEEWIKLKSDADKRARLLPVLLDHVRNTRASDHQSREAAISLITNLLVNKTSTPDPCKFGPLVLFKALQNPAPGDVELLTRTRSISQPIARYVERCLQSRSEEETVLGIEVVRRLPVEFIQKTRVPELLLSLATSDRVREQDPIKRFNFCKPRRRYAPDVDIPSLSLLALRELDLDLPEEERVCRIISKLTRRHLKPRELGILLGLTRTGLLTSQDCEAINLSNFFSNFFREVNFTRCLPELVEWLSLLEESVLRAQLDKLNVRFKGWLLEFLQQSKARSRPDVTKLCNLLVKSTFFSEKFEEHSHLKELLDESIV